MNRDAVFELALLGIGLTCRSIATNRYVRYGDIPQVEHRNFLFNGREWWVVKTGPSSLKSFDTQSEADHACDLLKEHLGIVEVVKTRPVFGGGKV